MYLIFSQKSNYEWELLRPKKEIRSEKEAISFIKNKWGYNEGDNFLIVKKVARLRSYSKLKVDRNIDDLFDGDLT